MVRKYGANYLVISLYAYLVGGWRSCGGLQQGSRCPAYAGSILLPRLFGDAHD